MTCLLPNNASIYHLNSLIEQIHTQINDLDCITIATMFASNSQPLEHFKNICKTYNTEIKQLISAHDINDWVSDKTKGMITQVIDSIAGLSFMINAVYFKGSWLNVFSKSNTYLTKFYSNKDYAKCHMMTQFNIVSAIFGEDYNAIQLLYSETDDIRAAYIKPTSTDIDEFIEAMTNAKLTLLLKKLQETSYRMKIGIPKMTIKGNYKLIPSLQSIGLSNVFSAEATIPKIVANFGGINNVTQECIIKANEEGTKAVAVSSTTSKHGKPKEMIFNSSFIFIIFHKDFLEHFLFIAKVEDPSD